MQEGEGKTARNRCMVVGCICNDGGARAHTAGRSAVAAVGGERPGQQRRGDYCPSPRSGVLRLTLSLCHSFCLSASRAKLSLSLCLPVFLSHFCHHCRVWLRPTTLRSTVSLVFLQISCSVMTDRSTANDVDELQRRFGKRIAFGTAGLRG